MDYKAIVQQIKVENEALGHVTRALEVAIAWVVTGDDVSRKLSSVRFAAELFQRQVERLFALEELDGYMETVCQRHPEWTNRVEDLKREHGQLRTAVRKLVVRLDRTLPTDPPNFDAICEDLRDVSRRILEHNYRENELLVESIDRETGGEG